jgi:hypothetical protein
VVPSFLPAAIELTGLAGTVALLVLPVLLFVVILLAHRAGLRSAVPHREVLSALDIPPATSTAEAEAWPERIRKAEAAGDIAAAASLNLAWARADIAAGRSSDAADRLRTTVRLAAQSKQAALHAEARIELAELAREAGDLTTACEHWQLARALFHDLKRADRVGDTERLMQRHGCPTDWVLNDF